jgi:hypothetical protein
LIQDTKGSLTLLQTPKHDCIATSAHISSDRLMA